MRHVFPILILLAGAAAVAPAETRELYDYAGVPALQTPTPVPGPGEVRPVRDRVRLGFYNIENFSDGIGDGSRDQALAARHAGMAAAILDQIDADILFLGEIENRDALDLINRALAHPHPLGWMTRFETGNQPEKLNLGLLTRIEPVSVGEIEFGPLLGPGRPPRGALRAVFRLDYKSMLAVYAVHLKSNYGNRTRNESKRRNAMQIIRDNADQLMASDPESLWHVVVLGDMNVDPALPKFRGDTSLKPFHDWTDLWLTAADGTAVTLPYRASSPFTYDSAAFDRILASPELVEEPWTVGAPQVLSIGVDTTSTDAVAGHGDHVSDHYPVYVDIRL